jgi:hypothetical protein
MYSVEKLRARKGGMINFIKAIAQMKYLKPADNFFEKWSNRRINPMNREF